MLKKLFKKIKFNILASDETVDINIGPGDSLGLYYEGEEILCEVLEKEMHVDKVVIFEFEHAMGMKEGVGGAFGKKE